MVRQPETSIDRSTTNRARKMTGKLQYMLRRAMGDPDHVVVVLEYEDKLGHRTRRVVSPIRFTGSNSFLALCLCREEPRRFDIDRCSNFQLAPAHQFAMPVPVIEMAGQTLSLQ
jgi:predicted DNA-binding transcriptional regulator YafY